MTNDEIPLLVLRPSPLGGTLLKKFVLGLSNPSLTDDSIGIHIVREIATRSLPTFLWRRVYACSGRRYTSRRGSSPD